MKKIITIILIATIIIPTIISAKTVFATAFVPSNAPGGFTNGNPPPPTNTAQPTVTNTSAVPSGTNEFGTSSPGPTYVLLAPLPCVGATAGSNCTSGSGSTITSIGIQGYLLYAFKLFIAIAVFLSVVMTIFGGFKYMTIESVTGKSDAKQTIVHAMEGLLLALTSYLILVTINPDLVNLTKVTVPKLNVSVSTSTQNSINNIISSANQSISVGSQAQQSASINANATAAQNKQTDQNTVSQLQNQISACQTSTPPCDTSTSAALQSQLTAAQNKVNLDTANQNTQQSINTMTTAAMTFRNTNAGTVGGTDITTAQNSIQTIENTYNQTYSQLPNNDVGDKQLLTVQRTYEEASIANDYMTNNLVNNLLTNKIPIQVTDAKNLISALQNNSIPNQTNSSGIITNPVGTLNSSPSLQAQYSIDNQARIQKIKAACGIDCN